MWFWYLCIDLVKYFCLNFHGTDKKFAVQFKFIEKLLCSECTFAFSQWSINLDNSHSFIPVHRLCFYNKYG